MCWQARSTKKKEETHLTAQPNSILNSHPSLIPQNLSGLVPARIPDRTCIAHTPAAEGRRRPRYPCQNLTHPPGQVRHAPGDVDLKGWGVPEMGPDGQAEVAEGDGFVVLDEKGLAGGGLLEGVQVLCCQNVGVSNVRDVGDVPQVEAIADYKGGLPFVDAGVDGREQLRVSGATEHRGSEGTGCHCAAVGLEDQFLCRSLFQSISTLCSIRSKEGSGVEQPSTPRI